MPRSRSRFELVNEHRTLDGKPLDVCKLCGEPIRSMKGSMVLADSRRGTGGVKHRYHVDCVARALGIL